MTFRPPARATRHPFALAALAALAGCAGADGTFPSLEPRPVERLLATPPVETRAIPVVDAALDARAEAGLAAAAGGARTFAAALAVAKAAAERAGARTVGSEPWFAAQQALTALGAARAPVATVLADLDRAVLDAAARATPVETARLDAAQTRIAAVAQAQDRAYEALAATVPNE